MDRSRLSRFINQKLQELPLDEPALVSPSTPVREALALMQMGSRSCVLAIDGGRLSGIFTERDVLSRCMAPDFAWDAPLDGATNGASVLTQPARAIASDCTVGEAMAMMIQRNYRTLPVVNGGEVTGLVRLGDLLTQLAEAYPEEVLNLPPRPDQVMERPEGG